MPTAPRTRTQLSAQVQTAVAWLKRHSSAKVRDGMARYGLPSDHAFGVPMGLIQKLAKQLGHDHELAAALWETGHYEARLLVAYVGDPARLTSAQMDQWCADFDNWGVVDTLCFTLFNESPLAAKKIVQWAKLKDEFGKRAAFALLACLPWKTGDDERFLRLLPLIERGAADERNFVKKGVSWALRSVGRRSVALYAAALEMAERLAASEDATQRWVGKDSLRHLKSPAMKKRIARLLAGGP